jgi:hypothetical protein
MGFFDGRILNVLKDGKPRVFNQVLNDVRFSRNTLRLHLDFLVDQGFMVKEKSHLRDMEDQHSPIPFLLKLSVKFPSPLSDPFTEVVSITFSRLRHLCSFEKGGYCKNIKKRCEAQSCPQILNKE